MNKTRTAIIANGGANTASLGFALERLDAACFLTADARQIRAATHVILPGVGAAGDAMRRLRSSGLYELIPRLTQPVLGICLGMQLLFEASEEDAVECLGIIPGTATHLRSTAGRPVPHMGWNTLENLKNSPLLTGIASAAPYAYFVHSYAIAISEHTSSSCEYGFPFSASVERDNFFGVQFHPERSARLGARVLQNFLALA